MKTRLLVCTTLALLLGGTAAILIGGCGPTTNPGSTTGTGMGSLRVYLTDAPGDYESVVISIKEIRVVKAEEEQNEEQNAGEGDEPNQEGTGNGAGASSRASGGLPLIASFGLGDMEVDVLALSFRNELLGTAALEAGKYNQVRLVLYENPSEGDPPDYVNYVTYKNDPETKVPIKTPSAQQSGLKIVGQFEVGEGGLDTIVLDFDPNKAIVKTGNDKLIFKPTGIRITQVDDPLDAFGALAGTVVPEGTDVTTAQDGNGDGGDEVEEPPALWETAPLVELFAQGEDAAAASGTVNEEDGTFRIFAPAGTYTIHVTAEGYTPYDSGELDPPAGTYDVVVGEDTEILDPIELALAPE